MSYRATKELGVKTMARARRLLVLETVRNMQSRYATYVRRHNEEHAGSFYQPTAKRFDEWLRRNEFEKTYLWMGDGGHQLMVRQGWTRNLLEKKVTPVTVGVDQTIDWFLKDLGKELTNKVPGYVVTVYHTTTNSDYFTTSPSLFFKVVRSRS